MITINPQAADVITIQLSDADQIQLNTTAIVLVGGDSGGGNADTLNNQAGAYYLSRANHTNTQAISTITGLDDALSDLADADSTLAGEIVAINNVLPLKADLVGGVIPSSQIPAIAITELLTLSGNVLPSSEAEMLTLRGQSGDFTIRTDESTTYVVVSGDGSVIGNWIALPQAASPVLSVNGQTGVVTLGRADVGINSSDDVPEGSSDLYFTTQRVRDTPLTGLSLASATPITAADSVLNAAGKLQAQITAAGSGSVARRMPAGFWQTATGMFANSNANLGSNVAQYIYFYVPQTIMISQVSFNAVATQAAGEFKLRFYDLANNAAVSPEYVIPAAGSGLITYTLPSPLTIPAGNYFFGLLSNTVATRQILGVAVNSAITFPSTDGVLSVNRTEGRLYSAGLPETATLGVSTGGNQANINFLVTA